MSTKVLYSEQRNDIKYLKSRFQPIPFPVMMLLLQKCEGRFDVVVIIATYVMYSWYMNSQGIEYFEVHDWLRYTSWSSMKYFWVQPYNKTMVMWRHKVPGEFGYINEDIVTWTHDVILRVDLYIALDFMLQELDLDYEYAICVGNVAMAASTEDWGFMFRTLLRILYSEPESGMIVFEKYSITVDDYVLEIEDAEEFAIDAYNYSVSRLWRDNILKQHKLSRKSVNYRIVHYNMLLKPQETFQHQPMEVDDNSSIHTQAYD